MSISTNPHPLIDPELWTAEDWTFYFHLLEANYAPSDASDAVEKDRAARAEYRAKAFA